MTWQIWFACAAIVLAVVGLVKRYETRMVLLLAGFAMCIVGGDPMKAFQAFVKGMTNITLVPAICSARALLPLSPLPSVTSIWLPRLPLPLRSSAVF